MTENKINLEEQIKLLVELQELDTQIFKLQRDLEEIPEDIKKMDEEFENTKATLKRLEDELKAIQLKKKEKELDLESREQGIKKLQTQLYQVKTNKEYTTMEQEIARGKADSSLVEEDIIKILDQIDEQNKKIQKEKDLLKEEEVKFGAEKKKKAEESKRLEEELAGYRTQRATLTGKIDKTVLSKYERILGNRDGLAVVPILSESCQGCFQVLPPQVINEVRMKQDIVLCENCTRILYSLE